MGLEGAVYVLEEGKKEKIKEVAPRGSHSCLVRDPSWAPMGGQGTAPRETKEGAQERALKNRVLEE
jgi:hypothetical protein